MRKKLFTFLLALVTSVGVSWATVITWDQSKLSSMAMIVSSGSDSKTSDGITVTAVSTGEFVVFGDHGGAIEIGNGEGSGGGYLTFTSSVGNIAQIDINHSGAGEWRNANGDWISPYYENFNGGMFRWSGTPAASITLTGDAPRHIDDITSIEFTIEDGGGSTPTPSGDKLSGAFSVSGTKVVYFSKGNLQYTKSTGKWKIMDHQYDVVETLSQNVGTDYASQDVITLFGWGTSGWESDTRLADFPYYTDYNNADYGVLATKSADETLTDATANGEKGDWGVYNSSDLGAGWRTLTNAEWGYLFNSRTPGNSVNGVSNARYTEATINTDGTAVNGIILFPDDAVMTSVDGVTWGTINGTSAWTTTCTIAGWTALETAGCVFLPAAGDRNGTSVDGVGSDGTYWSSSANSATYAYFLTFSSGYVNSQSYDSRGYGCSVRLVSETAPSGGSTSSETTVTWDLSDMASMGTQGGYFKAKGITLMAYGVDNGMTGYGSHEGAFFGGPFVFTTSLGKFTKIEVTNSYLYEQPAFSGDGWTLDGTNAVWEGTPAALVSLVSNFGGITQIKFTIDPNTSTPANSCGDGLTWAVSDGVLTISYDGVGTGSMDNYDDPLSMPWFGQNITSVVLPEGLISIGQNAFAFINTFSQITLPSTLQYILMNAFSGCGLTSVTIPENVKGISASAFISSQSLATVTFEPTTPPRVGGNAFENCHSDLIIYYPCESRALYYKDLQADIAYYRDKMYNCPAPPSNLHVTELEPPASWSGKSTYLGVADMPGFEETDADLAETWEAPTDCNSVLIYHVVDQYGDDRMYYHYFYAGDFVESQDGLFPLGTVYSNATNYGIKTFYTSSGGGSTPAVDPAVQNVIDLIDAIGSVTYTQACKDKIDAARDAYDALNADQKALVSNYSTLTDAEDAYAALIPVVTNYSISLDGITENADKVTISAASAEEGATVTLTPAEGYQITSFTASYASASSVRVTADPSVDVYEATPYVGALPKEFTENVTPGLNGATFHSIEGDDPFTPVPASVLEYVGMNAAKDQMTIRVNDAFSGIIRVNYTYNVENCEWDDYEQQEICMGGTAVASVRVVCEAAGGVAPASKDAVTGAYSFTMPAGNVTITATVEAIPAPAPTAVETGDNDDAETINTKLEANDGQTVDEWTIVRPVYRNTYYNTLCLPFDMDAAQIAASSIAGAEIKEFTGAEVVGDELLIDLAPVDEIEAGKPYFIKYSSADALTQLDFTNVTIDATAPQSVTFNGVTLQGTFVPFQMEAQSNLNYEGGYLFLGQNNQLFWPGVTNSIKPFRAYFYVDTTPSNQNGAPKRYGMPARFNEEQVATSIGNVQGDKVQSTKVLRDGQLIIIRNGVEYNANGMMVK